MRHGDSRCEANTLGRGGFDTDEANAFQLRTLKREMEKDVVATDADCRRRRLAASVPRCPEFGPSLLEGPHMCKGRKIRCFKSLQLVYE